jgi:hypothetical protein
MRTSPVLEFKLRINMSVIKNWTDPFVFATFGRLPAFGGDQPKRESWHFIVA